jgi:hypothetical protein
VILNHKYLPHTLSIPAIFPSDLIRNVSTIKTHENFPKTDGNFDADIAILTLAEPLKITNEIRPACLPPSAPSQPSSGTIVGFTKSPENHTMTFTEIKVANITSCLLGDEKACELHDDDFTCTSQSSSGFYSGSSELVVSGIFSKGLRPDDSQVCGVNNFIVFTFVAPYVEWIRMAIAGDDGSGDDRDGRKFDDEVFDFFCDYRWNYEQ